MVGTISLAQKRTTVTPPESVPTRSAIVDPQTGATVLCKGSTVPDGFVIAGEMFFDGCQGRTWILKTKPARAAPPERTSWVKQSTFIAEPNEAIAPGQCDDLEHQIKATYNFRAGRLSEAQIKAKSAELDIFWDKVKSSPRKLVPCLRHALREEVSDSFFNIDGSNLLVEVDPSPASKALQVRKFIQADLGGADLEYWVRTMARRGVEGFDVSEAGARWLSYPKAKYRMALHGGYPVGHFLGAVFIFGSMNEDLATPVLIRIVNQTDHPNRADALAILTSQATPASFRALQEVNLSGYPPDTQRSILEEVTKPKLLQPRAHPKLTREENIRAFQGIVDGDYSAFRELVLKAPDGEVDAVATLLAEDIPLLRRARRASIARCNQHAVSDYASFSSILKALSWKYEVGNAGPQKQGGR
jgi:hypothetical protein